MNAPIPLRADPGAMRAAAVTSLTRAALATRMGRLDTNYPEPGALLADKKLRLLSISGAKWSQARSIFR